MAENQILDELHAVREQLLANAGGTLAGLVAQIQADQKESGREIRTPADNNEMNRSRA